MSNKIKRFLGIDKWYDAGYTGKGIKVLSIERVSSAKKFPNVIAVNGYGDDDRGHGDRVMEQMIEIAPDATYITCSKQGNTSDYTPLYLDYILNNNVQLFTSSKLSSVYKLSPATENYMQKCIDNGTTFFIGAGNGGGTKGKDIYPEAKSDKYLTIGACKLDSGCVSKEFYSCEGEELDYMALVGWNGESGSSYATNRFCAMCALVQQFFLENAGRTLIREELVNFINDNLIDLKKEGFDTQTGYGLFILPEIESIDISKYVKEDIKPAYIDYGGMPTMEELKIKDMLLTPSEWNRPQTKIKPTAIAWHYVGNPNTSALANRNYFENLSQTHTTKASCHYIIGLDGEILHLIPDDEMSYCTNQANPYTISVECCHPDSTGKFTEATYKSMIWLGKYLMGKYGIKENIRHYDVTGKCCPKWFVDNPKEWKIFKSELEGEVEEVRYKTVEEMPEYYRKDIKQLVDKGIIAGRGGEAGLDLSDDMCRMAIYAKKIFECKE